jgi:hypothetical protein
MAKLPRFGDCGHDYDDKYKWKIHMNWIQARLSFNQFWLQTTLLPKYKK